MAITLGLCFQGQTSIKMLINRHQYNVKIYVHCTLLCKEIKKGCELVLRIIVQCQNTKYMLYWSAHQQTYLKIVILWSYKRGRTLTREFLLAKQYAGMIYRPIAIFQGQISKIMF